MTRWMQLQREGKLFFAVSASFASARARARGCCERRAIVPAAASSLALLSRARHMLERAPEGRGEGRGEGGLVSRIYDSLFLWN